VLNSGVSLVDDNGDNIPDEAGSNLTYFIPAFGENGIANVAYSLISTVTEDNYGYVTGRWMLGATLAESSLGPFTSTKYIYVVEISNNETYSLHTCGVATSDYIFSMTFEKNGEEYKCNMNSISEFSAFIAEMKETVAVGDTATVRPRSLSYDYDGEQVLVNVLEVAPLAGHVRRFDKNAYAGYEFIDFR